MEKGMVSLVGAGCGDPEFLTVKAQNRLQSCEVLVYDSLVAEQIVEQAPADCEKIYVGKRYGRHAMKQEEINGLLVEKAREGKRVVRLKGGDPYVFGRGGEEFLTLLENGIFCEEIPGITSAVAVPAAAGIPVTHRGMSRSFTVLTGTTAEGGGQEGLRMDFGTLAKLEGTLVILMGVHHLEEIADGLMAAGKNPETPCAVVMEGATARQKCVRASLHEIAARAAQAQIEPPAVIVIGAVAQLELTAGRSATESAKAQKNGNGAEEAFAEKPSGLPLHGVRASELPLCGVKASELSLHGVKVSELPLCGVKVGVTGTPHFSKKLAAALQENGAVVCDMSFMEIRENPACLPGLQEYGWLVFTSPNGVRIFLDKMKKEKKDLRSIAQNKIAVIGPGTAQALEEAGIYADYMPQAYNAEHLAEGLARRILEEALQEQSAPGEMDAAKKPALFLRAFGGSKALPRIFKEKGIPFTEFGLYEIGVDEAGRKRALKESPDYLVFGAGSGVRAYFDGNGRAFGSSILDENVSGMSGFAENAPGKKSPRYVCMGEACGRELARFTEEKFLTAKESSVAGIVECICSDLGRIRR